MSLLLSIVLWLLFGAFVGWVASKVMGTDSSQGTMDDILLGISGAIAGGLLMDLLGFQGVDGISIYSFVVSLVGAIVVIALGRALLGSR
jgi:uncharacterized membrane protein YeaQ/YmgE (transglycosylase-associated protein family)